MDKKEKSFYSNLVYLSLLMAHVFRCNISAQNNITIIIYG
ncbi:hypothetical protein VINE108274_21720 [Vibrio neptunius]